MEHVLQFLEILLLLSVPQLFCITLFVLIFLDIKVRYGRLVLYTVTLSVFQNISFMAIGNPMHLILSIALNAALLRLFYSELGRRTRLLAVIASFIMVMLSDLVSISFAEAILSYEAMINGPLHYKWIAWPFFLIFLAAAFWIKNRQHLLAGRFVRLINEATDRVVLTFIGLVFGELMLLSMYLVNYQILQERRYEPVLFGLGLLAIIAVTLMCGRLTLLARQSAIVKARSVYVDELLQLFATAKGQRHDFVNHVQTMYAMLQLGKHTQLQTYMQDIVEDVRDLSEQSNALVLPALAALLQSKSAFAADQRIRFDVSIPELPVDRLAVNTFDLVSITRSMLELAFDQILRLPSNQRKLTFDMSGEHRELVIRVTAYHVSSVLPGAAQTRRGQELASVRRQALLCNATFSFRSDSVSDAYELHVPLSGAV